MTRNLRLHRWTHAALIAAALTLTIAGAAQADSGWRRWKHEGPRFGSSRRVVVLRERDHGGAGPALAGLISGFVLGATMAHPQPVVVHDREYVPVHPRYRYEDSWSSRWWDSLDECRDAAFEPHGPRVIRVVDNRTDECVRTLYWKHDHFVSDEDRDDYRDD